MVYKLTIFGEKQIIYVRSDAIIAITPIDDSEGPGGCLLWLESAHQVHVNEPVQDIWLKNDQP